MLDAAALRRIIEQEKPDFVVPEIEAIATEVLLALEAEGVTIIPTARATRLTMEFPVWHLTAFGGGFWIILIAVLHVYVAHFAVGGGLFLVMLPGLLFVMPISALWTHYFHL